MSFSDIPRLARLAVACAAAAMLTAGCTLSQSRVDTVIGDYQESFSAWVQKVSREPDPAVQQRMVADRPLPDDYADELFAILDEEADPDARFTALRWLYAECQGDSHRDRALRALMESSINEAEIVTIAPHLERDGAERARGALLQLEEQSELDLVRAVGRVSRAVWLLRHHPDQRAQAEQLLESARADYGAVATNDGSTIEELAAAHLFDLRNLAVGALVPEVRGVDQHGSELALSSFRGKVVLMPFWAHW